jgi:hypothetical protein
VTHKHPFSLAILGILTATLAAEGVLRLIEKTPFAWKILPIAEVSLYGPDIDTGYTLRPNISGTWITENRVRIEINSLGLRDKRLETTKPAGEQRVALVGNSFAEALQVNLEETYQTIAEKTLSSATRNIELINLGLAGATPAVQAVRAQSRGLSFQPDLFLFMTNFLDFAVESDDDTYFPAYVVQADGHAVLKYGFRDRLFFKLRMSAVGRAGYWILDHSKLVTLINNRKNQGDPRALNYVSPPPPPCERQRNSAITLLRDSMPADLAARLDAFISDLDHLSKTGTLTPVILSLTNLPGCTEDDRKNLVSLMQKRLEGKNVIIIDFESFLEKNMTHYPGVTKRDLRGFGLGKGTGHLNEVGHKIYAGAVVDILRPYLAK